MLIDFPGEYLVIGESQPPRSVLRGCSEVFDLVKAMIQAGGYVSLDTVQAACFNIDFKPGFRLNLFVNDCVTKGWLAIQSEPPEAKLALPRDCRRLGKPVPNDYLGKYLLRGEGKMQMGSQPSYYIRSLKIVYSIIRANNYAPYELSKKLCSAYPEISVDEFDWLLRQWIQYSYLKVVDKPPNSQ
ncbi:hypothetical protein OAN12_01840 [Halioglobus sp.]|nr:hypothetical protein [Halioglobus sp.]